jgi:two-component system response regulator YesN
MLKLLIVEDEQVIRDGIVSMLNWKNYGIQICGSAVNGQEGLKWIRSESPDIVLTDIQMPQMDGLQMIQLAKNEGFQFESIILSGHSDFHYAQTGIRMGVHDYVLKPSRPDDILKTVLKIKYKIRDRIQSSHGLDKLMSSLNRNNLMAKEQTLYQWTQYSNKPLENRHQIIKDLNMKVNYDLICVGIVRMDTNANVSQYRQGELELIRYAVNNIVSEMLSPIFNHLLETFRDGNDLLWLANMPDPLEEKELKNTLVRVQGHLENYLKLSVSVGIGSVKPSIESLELSYYEAKEALEQRYYDGAGGIYLYTEQKCLSVPKDTIFNDSFILSIENEMLDDLRQGNFAEALDKMEQWVEYLKSQLRYEKNEVDLKATAFILELKKLTQKQQASSFEWKQTMFNWVEQMPNIKTFDEFSSIMKRIMQNLVENLKSETSLHRTVQLALDTIRTKYNTNLTLDTVAKAVFVSTSYLSTLFKQELGVNFLDYLHQYRVEKAKTLLKQNFKIYAVAKQVGYQDERHFSATFKRWVGLTPSQFQRNLTE